MGQELFSVDSKVVVVTGGLGQLGSQFARTLLERGAAVAVLDLPERSPTPTRSSASGCRATGSPAWKPM